MPTAARIRTLESFSASQPDVHTSMTGLRTVSWRNWDYFNSLDRSFVFEKSTKLIECPGVRASALRLASGLLIGSIPNTSQIFDSHEAIRFFGIENYGFADDMVGMTLESSFLARRSSTSFRRCYRNGESLQRLFQQCATSTSATACAFRGFLLEISASSRVLVSNIAYFFTRPFLILRGHTDVSAPKVTTYNVISLDWLWSIILHLYVDVVVAISVLTKLCRRWLSSLKFSNLIVTSNDRNMLSATNQSQADRPVFLAKSKNPSIIISRCRLV